MNISINRSIYVTISVLKCIHNYYKSVLTMREILGYHDYTRNALSIWQTTCMWQKLHHNCITTY